MLKAMVAYPTLRIEPTETGSRFSLYWVIRAWARHHDGWMVAVGRVNRIRGLVGLWKAVRLGVDSSTATALEAALRGAPGIRVTEFTTKEQER